MDKLLESIAEAKSTSEFLIETFEEGNFSKNPKDSSSNFIFKDMLKEHQLLIEIIELQAQTQQKIDKLNSLREMFRVCH